MPTQYCQLDEESLLHIEGPDSLTFLQGQTSCDTRNIDPKQSALGVYCTPQGRVVCDFLLAQLGQEHFALRLRRDLREAAAAVFGKYIVFSKAQLDASREDWLVFAVWGPDARNDLLALFPQVPDHFLGSTGEDDFLLVQVDERGERYECYLRQGSPSLNALDRWEQAPEALWQRLDIQQGMVRIEAATSESEVPQVLNFDLTGHINFEKGCYTGQEVVARLHYRGKSKRRTYLIELADQAQAGDAIFATDREQSVGMVVNCSSVEPHLGLAALTTNLLQEELVVGAPGGSPVSLLELPYSLE